MHSTRRGVGRTTSAREERRHVRALENSWRATPWRGFASGCFGEREKYFEREQCDDYYNEQQQQLQLQQEQQQSCCFIESNRNGQKEFKTRTLGV